MRRLRADAQTGSVSNLLARLDGVVWSGIGMFSPSVSASERRKPSVCRSGRWKTMRTVKAVSIATWA
jgi:hypothetical protein